MSDIHGFHVKVNGNLEVEEGHPLVSIVKDLLDEYARAKEKHGENTLDGNSASDLTRLAALVEETGEVAQLLTYDHIGANLAEREHSRAALKKELTQVGNVAITWASVL